MLFKIIGAGVLAFAVSAGAGRKLVPWLKEHGYVQPLKQKVADEVYSQKEKDAAGSAESEEPHP